MLAARLPLYFHGDGYDNGVGGIERREQIVSAKNANEPDGVRSRDFLNALGETVDRLSAIADRVVIVLPTHVNGWAPVSQAQKLAGQVSSEEELFDRLAIPLGPVLKRSAPIDALLGAKALGLPNIDLVNPRELTCDYLKRQCYGGRNGVFYFSDSDHLSLGLNREVTAMIARRLDQKRPAADE